MTEAAEFHAIVRPAGRLEDGFGRSYEDVAEELAKIPRLHIEPDGSFVWVSAENVSRKINGQITDDGHQVMYIEFRGKAASSDLQPILATLRGAAAPLQFQLLPTGDMIDEAEFSRRLGRVS